MLVDLSQYRGAVGLFNSKFITNKQSNIFYCAFFQNLDILAITSTLFSIFDVIVFVINYKWSILHLIKMQIKKY